MSSITTNNHDTTTQASHKRKWNFSAGPGVLPSSVLAKAQATLLCHPDHEAGCSVLEMSHRSPAFMDILSKTKANFIRLLNIPSPEYEVLFMPGGATAQFACVVLNLISNKATPVDYIITGAWSEKAAQEAKTLGANVHVAFRDSASNGSIDPSAFQFSPSPGYIYYCDNETVHGVEFPGDLVKRAFPPDVTVVCDMSSNILSRKVNVSDYGVIFAGAQKNMGPAGVTVVIIRKDLLSASSAFAPVPLMLDYSTFARHDSMYNTPPCYPIYVCGLVMEWLVEEVGGLEEMERLNAVKAALLLNYIREESGGFYLSPVNPAYASRMNIPFRIVGKGDSLALEGEFLALAEKEETGLIQLKGHRSVGGIRASLYNAMPMEGVHALVSFMKRFAASHCV